MRQRRSQALSMLLLTMASIAWATSRTRTVMIEEAGIRAWEARTATGAMTAVAVSRWPQPERAWSTTSTRIAPRVQASTIMVKPAPAVMSAPTGLTAARSRAGVMMAAMSPSRSQVSRSRRITGQEVKPGESSGGRYPRAPARSGRLEAERCWDWSGMVGCKASP